LFFFETTYLNLDVVQEHLISSHLWIFCFYKQGIKLVTRKPSLEDSPNTFTIFPPVIVKCDIRLDLRTVKVNQHDKYLGHTLFR